MVEVVDPSDTLAVLKAARAWLETPEHWTTGVLWRGADGKALTQSVDTLEPGDCPFVASTCASGAICLVTGGAFPDAVVSALSEAMPRGIVPTNDGEGYEAVLRGYDRAIAAVKDTGAKKP